MLATTRQQDEQRLAELLADPNAARLNDRETLGLVYEHLYHTLKPMWLAKYGGQMTSRQASNRFTELLNEFFVRVLETAADEGTVSFGKVKVEDGDVRKTLRSYVSRALVNLFLDHYRRRKTGAKIAAEMEYLLRDFELYFRHDCPNLDYEAALAQFARWDTGDEQECRFAAVLRGKFVDGFTPQEIQAELQISQATYYRLHEAALAELRKRLTSQGN